MARQVTLTADPQAPLDLTPEQKQKVAKNERVLQLTQKNEEINAEIRASGFGSTRAAQGTPLHRKKTQDREEAD
jgi:hypothetical protein